MSKYFNGDKLSGYEDSPITYVYGNNLEECHKVIADLEAKLAEKDKEIQILTKQNKALVEEEDLLVKKLKELGVDCIEDLGKSQNQKAIEQLQELLEKTKTLNLMVKSDHYVNQKQVKVIFEDIIMQKISELKGDENEKEN